GYEETKDFISEDIFSCLNIDMILSVFRTSFTGNSFLLKLQLINNNITKKYFISVQFFIELMV
ncbi:MAG TPA: hypothetical protein VNJ50_14940, partial [Gelidibacter sp.]|uniref:hypothetical protein n=1 Tax=Gelidibacter sp. TaxID=2018083 RepID=UPI002D169DC6